ncbi:sialic acid synthase [Staphylococcus taiwanensis]|nr:sialic acid synthase [Staphylococcus taiwanensis]
MDKLINIHNSNINLTEEEVYAYHYLTQNMPHLISYFEDNLMCARDKISQRLITSLHRENLVNAKNHSDILFQNEINHSPFKNNKNILRIHFPESKTYLYAQIEGTHTFGRIDVIGPFYISEDCITFKRLIHPNEVLNYILSEKPELDNSASKQFKDDMDNSVANMALALTYQAFDMRDATQPLWELIRTAKDSYLRSEQAVIEGHPLHPGAKLRKGLNPKETIQYSSEYGNDIHLKCVLIHHSIANTQSLMANYNSEIQKHFPELYSEISQEISDIDNLEDYHVMVIHPWQFDHILLQDYADELESHLIIPLPIVIPYYAGLSFRTLMPKFPNTLPHIKLSTNVHITGEIRTLSEQTTHNGPLVTKILNDILSNDSDFEPYRIDTLDELCGIHFYNSNDNTHIQTDRSEQLGTLFRENIYNLIDQNTIPIIPSSLVATYKYNDEPPIISLIKLYKQTHLHESYEAAAKSWLIDYATQLLGIVIPLYAKYGIALEAHLQNSIATFAANGTLQKIYIRDFEGLRIDEALLNARGYATEDFHEKSRILTDSKTTVFNKVFYSTVQNHIGELILTIAKTVNEKQFENDIWRDISQVLQKILNGITNISTTRINEIADIMFDDQIDYKCVTTMRLEDEAHHYTYIKVDNPLH